MSWLFLDTSALVKRYHLDEAGSALVNSWFEHANMHCVTSRLTVVELQSFVMRQLRGGQFTQQQAKAIHQSFLEDIYHGRVRAMAAKGQHFRVAGRLLQEHGATHPLRSLDAIQLAFAIELRDHRDATTFVSADTHQLHVAQKEGFETLNPIK